MIRKDEDEQAKLEGKMFLNHYRMGYGVKQDLYYQGLVNNAGKEIEINESQSESDVSGAVPRAGSSRRSRRSVESVTSKGINSNRPMEVIKE